MCRWLIVWIFPALLSAGSAAPRNVDELRAALQDVLVRYQIPGAGVAIVTKDRVVWAGGVGKADLASGREVTADTLFRVGSISKSFVALALVKLAEEGRIDLEATLESVAPEIAAPNPWRRTHPVRIVHILEHTAGFDDGRFAEDYVAAGRTAPRPLEVLRRFPGPQRVRWRPGTRFAYSNPGYVVAGYLIEKLTGRPFDEYVRDAVLRPLGMRHAEFGLSREMAGVMAQGYNHRPPRPVLYRESWMAPAGDLISSVSDFVPYLQALLRREIPRQDRIEHGQTSIAAQAGLGTYGLGNYPWIGGYHRHGHSGLIEGFRSAYFYLPDAGVAYVVMSNSSVPGGGSGELYRVVHEYATQGIPKRAAPPECPGEAPVRWASGVYVPRDYRVQIGAFAEAFPRARRVRAEGGSLVVSGLLGGGRRKLVPAMTSRFCGFRREDEVEATVSFAQIGDVHVMSERAGYWERVPPWQPYVYAGTVLVALLVMASAVVYGFVWIWRGRSWDRAIPLAAVVSLAAAGLLVTAGVDDMSVLGVVNFRTAGYVAFSWLFAILAVTGLIVGVRRGRAYAVAVSVSCCVVAAALADWGLLGVRLWKY